jgi:acyl-[acyl carrier protein]--UDP-N-acetylglucosamine O-acyltransferase
VTVRSAIPFICPEHVGKTFFFGAFRDIWMTVHVNASVDHHCRLEDFAHLGSGVQLAGGVRVGWSAWMHAGSSAGCFVLVIRYLPVIHRTVNKKV